MPFSSTNLQTIHSPFTDGPRVHVHRSTDTHSAIEATGYFSNGKRLGLNVGDLLIHMMHTSTGSSAATNHIVSGSTGAIAVSSTFGSSAHNQAFNCTVTAATT